MDSLSSFLSVIILLGALQGLIFSWVLFFYVKTYAAYLKVLYP
jgi:hypothetical protein